MVPELCGAKHQTFQIENDASAWAGALLKEYSGHLAPLNSVAQPADAQTSFHATAKPFFLRKESRKLLMSVTSFQ